MKILIVHATAGAGHFKAAEAVYYGFKDRPEHQVVLVDALDCALPFFKKFYAGSYFFLISKIPAVWGFFFALLDIPFLQPAVRAGRRVFNGLNTPQLHRFLEKEQFDCIVSTHFLPTEVASSLKKKGRIRSRIVTVVTDFDVHRIWLGEAVDMYMVATGWTKTKMMRMGIAGEKIVVTGIPVNEKFTGHPDIKLLKEKLGIQEDIFTVLLATGSFGIGPIEEIIQELKGCQVLVVCGHNKSLYGRLNGKYPPLVKILGLVDNMHELMAASDAMITKPGGLSISEALVSQLPLIFFNAIPGQETNNIYVLSQYGIGAAPADIKGIVTEINALRSSRDVFLTALRKTSELAHPSAVKDIIQHIL